MDRLNEEYVELLSGEGSASEKFWQLNKRLRKDRRSAGIHMEMTRSKMEFNILSLLYDGVIWIISQTSVKNSRRGLGSSMKGLPPKLKSLFFESGMVILA